MTSQASTSPPRHLDGYTGRALLCLPGREVAVRAVLRGFFQPVDGRYHWYGRVSGADPLTPLPQDRTLSGVLITPHGMGLGRIGHPDHWLRLRVSGVGEPPFPVGVRAPEADAVHHAPPDRGR